MQKELFCRVRVSRGTKCRVRSKIVHAICRVNNLPRMALVKWQRMHQTPYSNVVSEHALYLRLFLTSSGGW